MRLGIAQVLEGRRLFAELTVEENLRTGAFARRAGGTRRAYDRVMELFPVLRDRRRSAAGYLSGGEQQMLAIGRALMATPRLLLLDEPSLGLAPVMVTADRRHHRRDQRGGTAVLLVEQNARMALTHATYGYVLETGRVVLEQPAADLLRDESVRTFYLGLHEDAGPRFCRVTPAAAREEVGVMSGSSGAPPCSPCSGITVRFAGVTALAEVSFEVRPGELFAIIGPNGAGKTSLFNVLSRVYRPAAGRVRFEGRDLLRLRTDQIARAGIARTFQNLGQFPHTTVLDYLLLGRHSRMRSGILRGGLYVGPPRRRRRESGVLSAPARAARTRTFQRSTAGQPAVWLQKRADLARALAAQPRLLLLDEPVAGMSLEESEISRRSCWTSKSSLASRRFWSSTIWRW